jgi:hypothetical protein
MAGDSMAKDSAMTGPDSAKMMMNSTMQMPADSVR